MRNTKPKHTITYLHKFINAVFNYSDGFIELRPIEDKAGGRLHPEARRWFNSSAEFIEKSDMIIDYCRRKKLGCHIGLLPRITENAGAGDAVVSGGVVWCDLDDKDFENGRAEIWQKLKYLDPYPSAIVASGGGLHLYYFLQEDTPADEIEEANKRLADLIGGDKCFDRARVLRLPHSWHQKNPAYPIQLSFAHYSEDEHAIDNLLDIWPVTKISKPVDRIDLQHDSSPVLRSHIDKLIANNQTLKDLWNGIGKATGDTTGSGYDYAFARECIWLGACVEDVIDAVHHRVESRGKNKPQKYYLKTVGKALADIERYRADRADGKKTAEGAKLQSKINTDTIDNLILYPEKHSRAGKPLNNLHNVITILETDPRWAGVIRFNEFKNRLEINGQNMNDSIIISIRLWIYRTYDLTIKTDMMNDAIQYVAQLHTYHPVQQYLHSLQWDNQPRLKDWLYRLMGAKDTPLNAEIGTRWLIQAVARILEPAAKTDGTLILQGPQGLGKSSALRILAVNPEWYRDSFINISTGRDAYTKLAGVWLYEFPELESTKGRDNRSVKAFLTSQIDTYRPAYARYDLDVPRQCIFAGTTNDTDILSDTTGNRRYWIVQCAGCLFGQLINERDQLWAEAVHIYKHWDNSNIWAWTLDPAVLDDLEETHQQYMQTDTWGDCIELYTKSNVDVNMGISLSDLLTFAIDMPANRQTKADSIRLSALLAGMGWTKSRERREGNNRSYFWYPND